MEQVDILMGEEAQQDMDLKSAFVPAIPNRSFDYSLATPNKVVEVLPTI